MHHFTSIYLRFSHGFVDRVLVGFPWRFAKLDRSLLDAG